MINSILRWLSDVGHDIRKRIINFFICVDQLAYSILTLGSSAPDETLSAGAYRLEQKGKWHGILFRRLIDGLFWFDDFHCRKAYESEIYGYQRARR